MKLAYVLNTYPQRSHSFIRRELQALERIGFSIDRIAMRKADQPMVDPLDVAEGARTTHVLEAGILFLFASVARQFLTHPIRSVRVLRRARVHGKIGRIGAIRLCAYFAEACVIASHVHDNSIEHLHAHFGTNATSVAMFASQLSGIPYSFTVHGPEEFDAPITLDLSTKIKHARFVVAISSFGHSQICRWADTNDWHKINVVHCGIEPEAFQSASPVSDGPRRLVCIGRFAEQKGHLILIKAFAQTLEKHPDLHLVLLGDGEMRPAIEAAIEQHNIGANVTLAGWVGEERIRQELNNAHALIAPSFAEGLPMVVMEAMANARPVISTYIAGTPELVQSGKTGWLVPAGDQSALSDAIGQLAEAPTKALSEMGENARSRVLVRHDIDVEATKLAHLFNAN